MEAKIIEELTCPITLELFQDPITVPCCGKALSRNPLREYLTNKALCPLCNGDLSSFDASTAQTNKNLLAFVELIKNQQIVKRQLEQKQNEKEVPAKEEQQQWALTINRIYSDMQFLCSCGKYFMCRENRTKHILVNAASGIHRKNCEKKMISKNDRIPIAEFRLNLRNSLFELRQSLFIMVVDKSGSMSGNPWNQVQTALMYGISAPHPPTHAYICMLCTVT